MPLEQASPVVDARGRQWRRQEHFLRLALKPLGLPFVNADVLARIVFPGDPEAHSYEAAATRPLWRRL
jgi:hypothetical protein